MIVRYYTYDVWGNPDEGFDVNDTYSAGLCYATGDTMTDDEFKILTRMHIYLHPDHAITLEWLDERHCEFSDTATGKPIGHFILGDD